MELKLTKKEFADAIGVSPSQVDNLVTDGVPRIKEGRRYYYGLDAITWYFQRKLDRISSQRPPALDEAKARKELAEAELTEMRLAQARKELVPIDLAQEELGFVLDKLRARLLNVPGRYAPMIIALKNYGEAKLKLDQIIHEAMLELMRVSDDLELEPSGNGTQDAAGKAPSTRKRKRRSSSREKGAKKKGGRCHTRKTRASS